MRRYFRIYKLFVKNSISELMAHRFNLLMSAVANIVWTIAQLFTLWFMFREIEEFDGWELPDLILLLGFGQINFYTMFLLYENNFNELQKKMIAGEIDRYLVRPVNAIFMLSFEKVSVAQIIPTFTTVIPLIVYGLYQMENLEFVNIIFAVLIIVISMVIFYFVTLALASLNFFFDDARSFKETVMYGMFDFNRVPLTVFPRILQLSLIFIVPAAFIGYFPVTVVRGDGDIELILALEILILLIWIGLARIGWFFGLRKYSGAS